MKITLLILICISYVSLAHAAEEGDSAKTYKFQEVVVTASRSPLDLLHSPAKITQISKSEINSMNGTGLSEILAGKTGLFIRQYGSGGTLQTVSFRGMSSEHSLVLMDGVPVNNAQTGLTDLRLISSANIEQIDVIQGGSSALYGSDAIGGVINIQTEDAFSPSSTYVETGLGSFGERKFGMKYHLLLGNDAGITLGTATEFGIGDFSFSIIPTGYDIIYHVQRENSDYHSQSIFLNSELRMAVDTRVRLTFSTLSIDRGTPGPVLDYGAQGLARQSDEQSVLIGSIVTTLNESTELNASVNIQDAYERYTDPSPVTRADNYYRNVSYNALSMLKYSIIPEAIVISGVEWGKALANGNALTERKERAHIGAFAHSILSSEIIQDVLTVSCYPSLRFDYFGKQLESWSPKIGAKAAFTFLETTLTLHSTYGRNFRVPTFNEYFYAGAGGIGNPALQPEKSVSFDAGVTITRELLGKLTFDLTYYSISTENRIIWLPAQQAFTSTPKNIGKTLSTGFETEIRWTILSGLMTFDGTYSYIDARKKNRESANDPAYDKQLLYVPLETGNFGLTVQLPVQTDVITHLSFWINDRYTGDRYIIEGSNQVLYAYSLIEGNVSIGFMLFGLPSVLKCEVSNLTDLNYEVMPRYPMPGRNGSVTFSVTKYL